MTNPIPIPASAATVAAGLSNSARHPGLLLDKYSEAFAGQAEQRRPLESVIRASGDAKLLELVRERRERVLREAQAQVHELRTEGPLTLHLSRAGAFENAGICLHPLYGFVYLPASGLKGLARSYAETLWLESQNDKQAALERIERIFGWAPGSRRGSGWLPKGEGFPEPQGAAAGSVVFHDGWPTSWPALTLDITNSHHSEYYQSTSGDALPHDGEDPVPVTFLAVPRDVRFDVAVSERRDAQTHDARANDVDQAVAWLLAGLATLGAGAKTTAGYGTLVPTQSARPPVAEEQLLCLEETLELVTPAFLAGAQQHKGDCDLRAATLRGQLRWWWRTLHAGLLPASQLRHLEGIIWGDTTEAGLVRVEVTPKKRVEPVLFDRQAVARCARLPEPPSRTALGLHYHSYGMHDGGKQRWFIPPGASWTVRMTAKRSRTRDGISGEQALAEARAALILLCSYGGVGSKSRRGFGCFADVRCGDEGSQPHVERAAALVRASADLRGEWCRDLGLERPSYDESRDASGNLHRSVLLRCECPASDPWWVLVRVGMAAQMMAQRYQRQEGKRAWGRPRKIGGAADNQRLASPIHYHVARKAEGVFEVRVRLFAHSYGAPRKANEEWRDKAAVALQETLGDSMEGLLQPALSPTRPASHGGRGNANRRGPGHHRR